MAVQNEGALKYNDLKNEQIEDIKKGLELFVPTEEYWDKFCGHSKVARGHKTFSFRRLVKPVVKAEDVKTRAELVAPRPTKIAVQTFERNLENYGDKAIYSREDLQYHFDDTVSALRDTLKEIAVQKLDFIKGYPFVHSACTVTKGDSEGYLALLERVAVILRKNGAKRWDGKHFLAHITPEIKIAILGELRDKGAYLSERVKVDVNGIPMEFDAYGDWIFSETTSPVMYNGAKQYIVFMGKRGIDNSSPITVAKLEGESNIELINNGLGSGILEDVDGKLTTDDNKQQGSIAINMDGLGAAINDDLCVIDCELTINEISKSEYTADEMSHYRASGNDGLAIEGNKFVTGNPLEIIFKPSFPSGVTSSGTVKLTIKKNSSSGTAVVDEENLVITDGIGKFVADSTDLVYAGSKYYVELKETIGVSTAAVEYKWTGTFVLNASNYLEVGLKAPAV